MSLLFFFGDYIDFLFDTLKWKNAFFEIFYIFYFLNITSFGLWLIISFLKSFPLAKFPVFVMLVSKQIVHPILRSFKVVHRDIVSLYSISTPRHTKLAYDAFNICGCDANQANQKKSTTHRKTCFVNELGQGHLMCQKLFSLSNFMS